MESKTQSGFRHAPHSKARTHEAKEARRLKRWTEKQRKDGGTKTKEEGEEESKRLSERAG